MTRKGQSITLSLQPQDKRHLEQLAREFGCTWGDQPNISRLIQAIARRHLAIAANHSWTQARLDALNQARRRLVDAGEIALALDLTHLLLERGETENLALRRELENFVESQSGPWRQQVRDLIRQRQSFKLVNYVDATGQSWQFEVRHAKLVSHEQREYLDCWCTTTENNRDLPELQHNWCFRLDRYQGSAIIPIQQPWREDFDRILVEFHLYGRLAHSYHTSHHVDDIDADCGWLDAGTYRVVRSVYNTYWLRRELRRHGSDCEVIAPAALRAQVWEDAQRLCQRYQDALL